LVCSIWTWIRAPHLYPLYYPAGAPPSPFVFLPTLSVSNRFFSAIFFFSPHKTVLFFGPLFSLDFSRASFPPLAFQIASSLLDPFYGLPPLPPLGERFPCLFMAFSLFFWGLSSLFLLVDDWVRDSWPVFPLLREFFFFLPPLACVFFFLVVAFCLVLSPTVFHLVVTPSPTPFCFFLRLFLGRRFEDVYSAFSKADPCAVFRSMSLIPPALSQRTVKFFSCREVVFDGGI